MPGPPRPPAPPGHYGPKVEALLPDLEREYASLRAKIAALDEAITPLAVAAGEVGSKRWGPLMRAGTDKSHPARQMERYADIYTSSVSNLLFPTPFVYLRSHKESMPHDAPPEMRPGAGIAEPGGEWVFQDSPNWLSPMSSLTRMAQGTPQIRCRNPRWCHPKRRRAAHRS